MKMPGPKSVIIIIKANQPDALAFKSTSLVHAGRFSDNTTQDPAART
jgi:hypothetical protein